MRVLFLDLDSTSAEHLGCYGYHRNTSPNIDRIAEEGVRFTNYYTSDAPCFPSRTALMTGQFGIHNGVVGHGGTAGDVRHEGIHRDFRDRLASESFPALFRSAGMKTALVSPFGERHSAWTFYAGFNEIYNTGKGGMESAEEVTPTVLNWIENNGNQDDWLLYVNYWDPHTPYRAPEDLGNPFADDPLPAWLTDEVLEEHKKKVGPHSVHEINMYDNGTNPQFPRFPGEIKDRRDLRKMIDGYDTGIRHMDHHIGQLFEQLEKQGLMEDLVIIITADHGENVGELGIYGEHGTADQGTCRIPMIIRWPGAVHGHVDEGFHYHLDLPPTIAEMLGKEPAPSWDGQSYAPVLQKGEDAGREFLVVSQCAHVCQRSVRFGDWLYIRTYHDGYHLFNKEMLFNIKDDVYEQHDLAKERPDLCREAVYYLNEWHDDMMQTMTFDIDPLWTVIQEGGPYHAKGNLKRYVKRLEETGRGRFVPELMKRHPREFE
ncbi:arylsulfatase A-like enzyme [Pullulanibacillus pueri]|uniref:Sulfatase n=1 Tax=Pullulanibacillus pueri TaxID=1437324 RepID=A0A8J2ZV99_9BACL|nr:sulfatase [Pullulanibacillus pueri]MBM7682049.1 arylsulfatase A-like enzyme [Pullulanibacillus pueri]GGH80173.1 sulfatase [Pullulanibacillus pueri]